MPESTAVVVLEAGGAIQVIQRTGRGDKRLLPNSANTEG